jgi:hypothetical protein
VELKLKLAKARKSGAAARVCCEDGEEVGGVVGGILALAEA